jgi:hypothetical protein
MGAHISGKEATYVALEGNKRGPIALEPAAGKAPASANVPEPGSRSETTNARRKPPVRVRNPPRIIATDKETGQVVWESFRQSRGGGTLR